MYRHSCLRDGKRHIIRTQSVSAGAFSCTNLFQYWLLVIQNNSKQEWKLGAYSALYYSKWEADIFISEEATGHKLLK